MCLLLNHPKTGATTVKTRRLLIAACMLAGAWMASVPEDADARGWRRFRQARTYSTTRNWQRSLRPSNNSLRYYSGVSRAEYDYWRRRDAWYDHAYNGFDPLDFR